MTPRKFTQEMQKIANEYEYDKEKMHGLMDDLMIKVLCELGYKKGTDIFLNTEKYYA